MQDIIYSQHKKNLKEPLSSLNVSELIKNKNYSNNYNQNIFSNFHFKEILNSNNSSNELIHHLFSKKGASLDDIKYQDLSLKNLLDTVMEFSKAMSRMYEKKKFETTSALITDLEKHNIFNLFSGSCAYIILDYGSAYKDLATAIINKESVNVYFKLQSHRVNGFKIGKKEIHTWGRRPSLHEFDIEISSEALFIQEQDRICTFTIDEFKQLKSGNSLKNDFGSEYIPKFSGIWG